MMKVRIIRCQANLLEERINAFFEGLGRQDGIKIKLIDIKLYHIPSQDMDTAMIIYNATKATAPSKGNSPRLR